MMKIQLCKYAITGLAVIGGSLCMAEDEILNEVVVEDIYPVGADPLSVTPKATDIIVDNTELRKRSGTLGNALSGELGVHSSQYGGGSSSPIIRGQEGVRVKVLSNGSDVIDMADLSPDHNHGVDTLVSSKVEIVRGASTLLYANASNAGVINVVDERIPTYVPEAIEGETSFRFNENSNEKLATIGLRAGIGEHIAVSVGGMRRKSDNYDVPEFNLGSVIDYVPDTQNETKAGTFGVSVIGDKGYIGASVSTRSEEYGIPGHNHKMDLCKAHITSPSLDRKHVWLYPHLMSDIDMNDAHFHCSGGIGDGHSHDNPYGYEHNLETQGPNVVSTSNRKDLKMQINKPIKGIDKLRFNYSTTKYHHDEKDADVVTNIFNNKGHNSRLEVFHAPVGGFTGIVGVQYQNKKSDANIPRRRMCSNDYSAECLDDPDPNVFLGSISDTDRIRWALFPNKNSQLSFFAAEKFENDQFVFDAAIRTEKQKIRMNHDEKRIRELRRDNYSSWYRSNKLREHCAPDTGGWFSAGDPNPDYNEALCDAEIDAITPFPDLNGYEDWATSYAASALWKFKPQYGVSFTYSHNERHPSPMELYYHGNHIATSSFEHGNKDLTKEISNNYEINTFYKGDDFRYNLSAYYGKFDNRIFNQTLKRHDNLLLNRYAQSKAVYYGVEGRVDYNVNDALEVGIFGDYVRGKLYDLSPKPYMTPSRDIAYSPQDDQDAPRVPPARLGLRANWNINNTLTADLEYIHAFEQKKVAPLENPTESYNLINLGLTYDKSFKNIDSSVFLKVNNVLDESIYSHSSHLPFVPQMGRNIYIGADLKF